MRALLPQLLAWTFAGERLALATVVRAEGSSPRVPGECLLACADGLRFAGSVSSGCLESEVLEAAVQVLREGSLRTLRFGPDGTPPWSDGLSCGGNMEVRVEPWWGCTGRPGDAAVADFVLAHLQADHACAVLSRGQQHLALSASGASAGDASGFEAQLRLKAIEALSSGDEALCLQDAGREPVFIRLIHARRRLLLVGASDLAVRLVPLARAAGLHVSLIDPRRAYADPARFPVVPDSLSCAWPGRDAPLPFLGARDAALVLSHDPKIDDPALLALLSGPCGYIGALGSATSHASRLHRLRAAGASDSDLARIEGPAGPRLGRDADAVALGLLAGVVRGTRRPRPQ